MAVDTYHTACTELLGLCDLLAGQTARDGTDTVDHHLGLRTGQTEGRIAQKRVLQLIGRGVTATGHEVAFRPAHGLSDTDAWCQHIAREGQVHRFVIGGIDGTGGTKEGHTPTLTVQHHGLADIVLLPVEGHDVARGRHPQGQLHRRGGLEVSQFHHQLVREGVGCSVSAVVHHQCATLHLLFDESSHVGIAVARRRGGARIGIPVDLLQLVARIVRLHEGGHLVGRLHVGVVISVVAHEADGVLPGSRVLVACIADGLVGQDGGTLQRPDGESSDGHIGLTQIGRAPA